ncbi:MAG TPA: gephyrin-like molybdotransferase Glp [Candidatus Eremiobacteraceae bacterium]
MSIAEALAAMARHPLRKAEPETVPVSAAEGRILAADARAAENAPPFTRSCVDGFAVIAQEVAGATEQLPVRLRVAGDVAMGAAAPAILESGTSLRVPTGGALPPQADGVVMIEDAQDDGGFVVIRDGEGVRDHVTLEGADVRAGDLLCERGTTLSPAAIGMLAAAGVAEISAYRAPRVAILVTGDELVPAGVPLGPGQIRDSNRAALCAALAAMGFAPRLYPRVPDDRAAFDAAFALALAENDAVVISGGSSVGERDYTPDVIDAAGPPGVIVHGIRAKPGRPAVLAAVGDKPVIGLPGNPVSALVVLEAIGKPILLRMFDITREPLTWRAELSEAIDVSTNLEHRIPVRLTSGPTGLRAQPLIGTSAHSHILGFADGLIVVPERVGHLAAGTQVDVVPFSATRR